jgi:hypothetical protein
MYSRKWFDGFSVVFGDESGTERHGWEIELYSKYARSNARHGAAMRRISIMQRSPPPQAHQFSLTDPAELASPRSPVAHPHPTPQW